MARLRSNLPAKIIGEPTSCTDLDAGWNGLPPTDAFLLQGSRARVVVRPSGTEPKLKCYMQIKLPIEASKDLAMARASANAAMQELREEMRIILGL